MDTRLTSGPYDVAVKSIFSQESLNFLKSVNWSVLFMFFEPDGRKCMNFMKLAVQMY